VIPLSITVTALLNLGMTLVAVLIFVFAHGVWPTWTWLELPVLIALIAIFATGISMLLSALYVRFRDMLPIWEVANQILFYGSGVLYVVQSVPPQYQRYLLCNPLAAIFTQMRHAVVDSSAPSITTMFGDARVLIPLGVTFGVFALGFWFFERESPKVAENL
jgi:ABC-2 type transport system permease protein